MSHILFLKNGTKIGSKDKKSFSLYRHPKYSPSLPQEESGSVYIKLLRSLEKRSHSSILHRCYSFDDYLCCLISAFYIQTSVE